MKKKYRNKKGEELKKIIKESVTIIGKDKDEIFNYVKEKEPNLNFGSRAIERYADEILYYETYGALNNRDGTRIPFGVHRSRKVYFPKEKRSREEPMNKWIRNNT